MNQKRRSRWAKRDEQADAPRSAEEYEAWFAAKVEEYRQNPGKPQMIAPKDTPSHWQLEGMRLVFEKRDRLARETDLENW